MRVPYITIRNVSVRMGLMKETSIGCRCEKAITGEAKVMDWWDLVDFYTLQIDCIAAMMETKTKGYLFLLPNVEQW
ncbi:hypothetical protein TNCV_4727031 [Trichonephila clavipes]|nr:hypothetical protein TNCV_4727031 [Trichonephila clavipes]